MSKGLLGAFLEAGAKSGVLKGTKSFNFGSLFGASLKLWSHPESFMELSDLEKYHLLRLLIPDQNDSNMDLKMESSEAQNLC